MWSTGRVLTVETEVFPKRTCPSANLSTAISV